VVRQLVVDWSELLAQGKFSQALSLVALTEVPWTPEFLQFWISNYGYDRPRPDGRTFAVSSLFDLPEGSRIIQEIEVDRVNPYGLDRARYVGVVMYSGIPLNGEESDLTAQFNMRRVWRKYIVLEFYELYVM
jgi:hypothetical protein